MASGSNAVQQALQHSIRIEIVPRELPGRARVALVICLKRLTSLQYLFFCAEGKQSFSGGQESRKTRVLGEDRAAGSQVANAAIAEPTALRHDITMLGDTEFCLG